MGASQAATTAPSARPMADGSSLSGIEEGQNTRQYYDLKPHVSTLPNYLYILSFSPPVPSPFRSPGKFINNPRVLYFIGTIGAMVAGVGLPAFDIVSGYWTNGIQDDSIPYDDVVARGSSAGWIMTMVGVVYLLAFTLFLTCFSAAGIKLSGAVREKYLASIMVQDQAFFDRVGAGEVVSRSSKDIDSIRIGLGERVGYLIWSLSTIIAAFVSAFTHVPKLAGVLFALIPTTMIMFAGLGYWSDSAQEARSPLDGQVSSFIETMLSSVRVVQSFDMGNHLLLKLEHTMLRPLRKLSTKVATTKALEQAAGYGVAFLVYSMCFWYGSISVANGTTIGDVITTFYNYVNLFFSFATIVPHLIAFTTAQTNLAGLRLQIERTPPIDIRRNDGVRPEVYEPSFELDGVTFAYPARPGHKALDNVSIDMPAGKFTAFAGPSGSGKSTAASLLLRLYDPKIAIPEVDAKILAQLEKDEKKEKDRKAKKAKKDSKINGEKRDYNEKEPRLDEPEVEGCGIVRFAGYDIRDLNVTWLRSQVAVVLQNPQLVSGTVFDNVVIGLTGTPLEYRADESGPMAEKLRKEIDVRVEEALKMAQAWDFVCDLPKGLETVVFGGRTGVLSGGQVQRVALARALVRQPKCLLLDEATSAVSADAELKIQEALIEEQKRRGMTLIVIAHRLSTIVAADKIVVMKDGRPVASGTYDALVDPNYPDETFRNMANASSKVRAASADFSQSSTQTLDARPTEKVVTIVESQQTLPQPMTRVSQAFSHVKYLLTIAIILGVAAGAAFVMAAYLHGRAVSALNIADIPVMRRTVDRWALWFLVLALGTFAVMAVHVFGLESSGESIVSEYRRESARALIRQDIPFFEREAGGSGSLTAAAASHPQNVGNVIGVVLSQFVTSATNLVATLIMAFVLSWRLAVMAIPSLFATCTLGYLNLRWLQIFEAEIVAEDEKQANYVADSVNSAQLNAALTRESEVLRQYSTKFTNRVLNRRWLIAANFALAGTQAMVNFFGGLLFWWGAKQRAEGQVSIANLFTVLEAVVIATFVSAKILTYTGDVARMRNSLKTMQGWLERIPEGSTRLEGGGQIGDSTPGFRMQGVQLRYPSRPDVLALKGIDVHLEPGKSYAFCGTSGAGKSSILALLQRFYEPSAGVVSLDGVDIRAMDVTELRSQMGYVSQEPILFEGSIRWNLIAGALDPEAVTQTDLEFACEQACILDFIKSLPEGFETDLGMKGGRLSGGQKQRLCIARALLRKPRILLLDEATSALDGQSEAHVQRALDNASKGRLTITIGHRLSAIKGADVIFVMEQGVIVETGYHEELVERKGRYFELIQAQL